VPEEAQVDYGTGPMVRDPQSGKYRRTRLFVLTLGYSRKSVRLLVFQLQQFADLGRTARESLSPAGRLHARGGARQSARGRAQARHLRSHAQSRCTATCWQHYGAVAMPCRVRDPDRKGKVESGVGHAQKTR
jgi:transposase